MLNISGYSYAVSIRFRTACLTNSESENLKQAAPWRNRREERPVPVLVPQVGEVSLSRTNCGRELAEMSGQPRAFWQTFYPPSSNGDDHNKRIVQ